MPAGALLKFTRLLCYAPFSLRAAAARLQTPLPPVVPHSYAIKRNMTDEAPTKSNGRYADVWETKDLSFLFENNRKWVERCLDEDPEFFTKLTKGQKPQFLFIGCSDSRVPAQEILGLKAGELFVHRNVANLVVNGDMNLLAVLQYSVEVLEVKDIIVCGHQGCGGVAAASLNKDHGLLEHWLKNIRDVIRKHEEELNRIGDQSERLQRLVELNVYEQCLNLYRNPIIQRKQAKDGYPHIHGFVYNISDGIIKKLKIDFERQMRRCVFGNRLESSRKSASQRDARIWRCLNGIELIGRKQHLTSV